MRARRGCGAIIGIVLLALLATVGYTAYAGTAVYRQLDSGRQELVAAQAELSTARNVAGTRNSRALRGRNIKRRLKASSL